MGISLVAEPEAAAPVADPGPVLEDRNYRLPEEEATIVANALYSGKYEDGAMSLYGDASLDLKLALPVALKVFHVPAGESASERSFSFGSNFTPPSRSRMATSTLSNMVMLKYNRLAGYGVSSLVRDK